MSRLSDNEDSARNLNDNDADVPLSLTTANNARNSHEFYSREEKRPSRDEVGFNLIFDLLVL